MRTSRIFCWRARWAARASLPFARPWAPATRASSASFSPKASCWRALGGTLGLLLAFCGTKAVLNVLPGTLPRAEEISLDGRVLLFTLALSLFAAMIFGLAPALKGSRVNLMEILKESGRGSTGARHRLQGVFVAIEVAMALVLLIGAGLMLRSLSALWRVNPGYNPSHAITFSLSMPSSAATTSAETRARLRQFDEKMSSIPGVQAVSVTLGSRPMIHDSSLPFWIEGRPKPANDNEMPQAMFYLVEAGFQQAMGITLERGRFVTPQDNENAPLVIDIDDVFARTYFPNENPIGKRVHLMQFNVEAEIVGVVGHIKQWGPGADRQIGHRSAVLLSFHAASREADAAGGERRRRRVAHRGRSGGGHGPVRRGVAANRLSRGDLWRPDDGRSPRRLLGCAQALNDSSRGIRGVSR